MKRSHIAILVIFLVLLIDQVLKFYIKLNFELNQARHILGTDFFTLHFVENPGMAFGMTLGGSYGKLLLSLFRIGAVFFIGYYMVSLIKKNANKGLVASIALIFAGAIGNIIDSVFYGIIFTDSDYRVAEIFPEEGGYAGWFHGKVVDMLEVHIFSIDRLPEWIPKIGGEPFTFFSPIFNVADAAITIGVILIILFQQQFFAEEDTANTTSSQASDNAAPTKQKQRQ
ncbi:MAG: lipoprotein signal peptidase [Chitinophagales bacterium]|nr:lipoprotein signal peptidase [Chitinophagales bacterium]